uniref:Si:dkeyp-86f7.4 n=1 Tax=Sinocyclocheilus rhinocerous TaxID=307959 RepID=A0A673KQ05_9TELE
GFERKLQMKKAVHGRSCIWLSVLVFQYCFQLSASLIYWTAYVEVRYFDSVSNETVGSICECGMFGADSPLDSASGLLVLPNSDPLACSRNTTFTAKHQPWIALIKRGNCTYSQKIRAAQREGASAVVIYNIDGTGNNTDLMAHSGMRVSLTDNPRQVSLFQSSFTENCAVVSYSMRKQLYKMFMRWRKTCYYITDIILE